MITSKTIEPVKAQILIVISVSIPSYACRTVNDKLTLTQKAQKHLILLVYSFLYDNS